jgi:hypothetical protein
LAGVVVGIGLTWGAGQIQERQRYVRDRRDHLRELRLRTYGQYAGSAKLTMLILYRVAASRGNDDAPAPLTFDQASDLLASALHDRDAAYEQLLLVGTDAVDAAAHRWVRLIYTMYETVQTANTARFAFHAAAREDTAIQRDRTAGQGR